MSNVTKLSGAIKFALFVGTASSAATVSAVAQESEAKTLDRVEVTGSRIKRADVETSQPIFTMDKEAIQAQGLTSIGDVIQNLTANGSALNTTFNNGGNGETRVSLRNLGSGRTLVLVNGRRWVGGTGLGGAVDLNTIPTAAVERIDVLKDGASTLYGSDAIAGVINVVLKKDYEGAEANVYFGQFGEGDGMKQAFDATIGAVGADGRFTAMMGASYVKEEPVMAGAREISAVPVYGTGVLFGSSTSPNGRFGFGSDRCQRQDNSGNVLWINPDTGALTTTDLGDDNKAWVAAGNQRPNSIAGSLCQPGTVTRDGSAGGNTTAAFRLRTGADAYNFAPDNYLVTPQERISTFARGRLQITDNVAADIQLTYNNRKSEQLLAAMPVTLGYLVGGGLTSDLFISQYNQYNPFGEDVTRVQRRVVETGGRSFRQNVDTFGFSGALEGSFEIGDRYFSWDAGMVYARNDQNDTTDGLFNVLALRQALGPSQGGVCYQNYDPGTSTYSNPIAGCVPLNLLGGVGTITPEMLGFSGFVAHDEFGYKMKQYFANISGDVFELPAGMVSFAAGLERRSESGFDQPDALINSGNTTGNARTATKGSYSLEEAYVEFAVPVLKDAFLAKSLELSIASRYSDYSNFGDTTNSKFGFKWNINDELLVRGNWSEGFRAPSIAELYQGVSDSYPQVADPCNDNLYGNLSAAAKARCVADGAPVGGYDQANSQILVQVGGSTDLMPETSTSKTLGFVWSPTETFDVSVDWWKIELEDTITAYGAQFILDQCIVEGVSNFCNLYTRGPDGSVASLLSTNLNSGLSRVEGYDITANYRIDLGDWGNLSFNWDTTYMADNQSDYNADGVIDAEDGGSIVGQYFDRSNNWEWRSNLMTRWSKGDFSATWSTRFYSEQVESCNDLEYYGFGDLCSDPNPNYDDEGLTGTNHIGGTTYHDISFSYKAPWDAKITLGINNVFEKEPPVSFTTFANSFDPQYEIPGRFWYMRYEQKF